MLKYFKSNYCAPLPHVFKNAEIISTVRKCVLILEIRDTAVFQRGEGARSLSGDNSPCEENIPQNQDPGLNSLTSCEVCGLILSHVQDKDSNIYFGHYPVMAKFK